MIGFTGSSNIDLERFAVKFDISGALTRVSLGEGFGEEEDAGVLFNQSFRGLVRAPTRRGRSRGMAQLD